MEIENEFLKLSVTSKGGSLTSVYDKEKNKELLYQPLKESWQGQDVFMFPFAGRLLEGTYVIGGKSYALKSHGLIRYMEGNLKKENDGSISCYFESDKETLVQYPYPFICYCNYSIWGKQVTVQYHIFNKGKEDMPFGCGCHPAFRLPGEKKEGEFDISGNRIVFDHRLSLVREEMEPEYHFMNGKEVTTTSDHIDLTKDLFREHPTVILHLPKVKEFTLEKKDGSKIRFYKGHAPYLVLWSDPKWGDYVAIEEWYSLPDFVGGNKNLREKKSILTLPAHQEYSFSYSFEIK